LLANAASQLPELGNRPTWMVIYLKMCSLQPTDGPGGVRMLADTMLSHQVNLCSAAGLYTPM